MKGQFMVISAVIVGLIVISTASTITEVQNVKPGNSYTAYTVKMIKDEARKVDKTSVSQRESFQNFLSTISYSVESSYWKKQKCFNVTLRKPGERLTMKCIG